MDNSPSTVPIYQDHTAPRREFIPPKDAAAYLGLSLSTLYRLIRADELPVYHLTADAPRLKVSDLEAFALGRIRNT